MHVQIITVSNVSMRCISSTFGVLAENSQKARSIFQKTSVMHSKMLWIVYLRCLFSLPVVCEIHEPFTVYATAYVIQHFKSENMQQNNSLRMALHGTLSSAHLQVHRSV